MKQKYISLFLCFLAFSIKSIDASSAGEKNKTLVAIGGVLLDVVMQCSTGEALQYGCGIGYNNFITPQEYYLLKKNLPSPIYIPGGSVANTTSIYAGLGGKAVFIGTAGKDQEAKLCKESLTKFGVDVRFYENNKSTGVVLVFVHPDGQRSMRSIQDTEIIPTSYITHITENVNANTIVVLEGYGIQADVKEKSYAQIAELAKQSGAFVAISASDPSCVWAKREVFLRLLKGPADLIFMNEEEAKALVQGTLPDAIAFLQQHNKIGVITLAEKGAIAVCGQEILYCCSHRVHVVDTTGAGDAFVGGFLYGLAAGWPIAECLQLANFTAGKVVTHLGARLSDKDLKDIIEQKDYKSLRVDKV